MEQRGKVISVDGKLAVVEIFRESACSSCGHRESCGAGVIAGCGASEPVRVKANNICGADVGDSVILNSGSAKTLGVAFCVFVLPLIITYSAYMLCMSFFESVAVVAAVTVLVFFISFFGLFFGFNALLANKVSIDITDVVG